VLAKGKRADFAAYPVAEYQEIFYNQGRVKPARVWKDGHVVYAKP
jgi:imidazolonepropionase